MEAWRARRFVDNTSVWDGSLGDEDQLSAMTTVHVGALNGVRYNTVSWFICFIYIFSREL